VECVRAWSVCVRAFVCYCWGLFIVDFLFDSAGRSGWPDTVCDVVRLCNCTLCCGAVGILSIQRDD